MNIIDEMSCLSPWFSALDREIKEALCVNAKTVSMVKDEILYSIGQEVTHLAMIKSGSLTAQRSAENGKNYVLASVGPGFLGHLEWVQGVKYSRYDIVCTTKSDVILIPIEDVIKILQDNIYFCISIMKYMSYNHIILEEFLSILALRTNIQKVAWILSLVSCGYCGLCRSIKVFPVSQEKFAETLGFSRQTLNYVLRDLEETGIVSLGREKITIIDERKMRELSGFSCKIEIRLN